MEGLFWEIWANFWEIGPNFWEIGANFWEIGANFWEIWPNFWETIWKKPWETRKCLGIIPKEFWETNSQGKNLGKRFGKTLGNS